MRTLKRLFISAIAACETFGVVILYVCYVYNIQVMHGDVRGRVCGWEGEIGKRKEI